MVYSYPTLNTYTYNVSMELNHYILYVSIQIYVFKNRQPILLSWHNIQAQIPIGIT